jgi:predicted enzyme related to lactoylglutathione lyase
MITHDARWSLPRGNHPVPSPWQRQQIPDHAGSRERRTLLGAELYFASEAAGRGSSYVEFRIGDYQHELGIVDRRFAPPGLAAEPGGVVVYWHVNDVAAALDRLVSLGARQLEAVTEHGPGFVTASMIDPFGNAVGIMYNRHYLDILRNGGGAQWAARSGRRSHACRRSLP